MVNQQRRTRRVTVALGRSAHPRPVVEPSQATDSPASGDHGHQLAEPTAARPISRLTSQLVIVGRVIVAGTQLHYLHARRRRAAQLPAAPVAREHCHHWRYREALTDQLMAPWIGLAEVRCARETDRIQERGESGLQPECGSRISQTEVNPRPSGTDRGKCRPSSRSSPSS